MEIKLPRKESELSSQSRVKKHNLEDCFAFHNHNEMEWKKYSQDKLCYVGRIDEDIRSELTVNRHMPSKYALAFLKYYVVVLDNYRLNS